MKVYAGINAGIRLLYLYDALWRRSDHEHTDLERQIASASYAVFPDRAYYVEQHNASLRVWRYLTTSLHPAIPATGSQ
jgi:hypothetical protein